MSDIDVDLLGQGLPKGDVHTLKNAKDDQLKCRKKLLEVILKKYFYLTNQKELIFTSI